MSFEQCYEVFMAASEKDASENRKHRLRDGHGHAEKLFLEQVWWPAIGNFEHLHPEYEVYDFKDGVRYLDFAYLRPPYRISLEIDGYGPHARDASRWRFADDLLRQNHLVLDDWRVIRFAYDDVAEKPRRCQQIIQQLMGRWFGHDHAPPELSLKEKEIVRLAIRLHKPITPKEVCSTLGIHDRYARELLYRLTRQHLLVPASGSRRVRSYKLNPSGKPLFL